MAPLLRYLLGGRNSSWCFAACSSAGLALRCAAATHGVPSDYPTIQGAIDASIDGDTVLVAPGVYAGPGFREIDFAGRDIALVSEAGAETTVIDLEESGYKAFRFENGEGPGAIVQGFTVSATRVAETVGCAFLMMDSSPTIRGCVIAGNSALGAFHGIGAGVLSHGGAPRMENCTIAGNSAATDTGPYGAGVWVDDGDVTLSRCIVYGNCRGNIAVATGSTLSLDCCIVEPEIAGGGTVVFLSPVIFDDPLFCGTVSCIDPLPDPSTFRLDSASPGLPANNECGVVIGALGVGCPVTDAVESTSRVSGITVSAPFPNPTTGGRVSFAISTDDPGRFSAALYDAQGRLVLPLLNDTIYANGSSYHVDLGLGAGVSAGSYFVRWTFGTGQSVSRRLVVR